MSTYAKFMKDLLMKKKRIMDDEILKPLPQHDVQLKRCKRSAPGRQPNILYFVLICVTLILCLIFLNFTFESLFMNYVFECLICFVRAIIAWPRDRPIF